MTTILDESGCASKEDDIEEREERATSSSSSEEKERDEIRKARDAREKLGRPGLSSRGLGSVNESDCASKEDEEVEEGRRTYGSRPKGDKPHNLSKDKLGSFGKDHEDRVDAAADKKHKEELAAARARLEKNPDSYKVKGGRKKKKVKENELADIKKGQDSIRNLNEQRNQKLNDELMRRLLNNVKVSGLSGKTKNFFRSQNLLDGGRKI